MMNKPIDAYQNIADRNLIDLEEHVPLVKRIAHHLMARLPSSVLVDDLIQSGMIGLIEAYNHFDATKGASFSTYAGIRIRGAILDEIRRGDWAPRSVHRNSRLIASAISEIENETGRDARDAEVAKRLEISLDEYYAMLKDTNGTKIVALEDLGLSDDIFSAALHANIEQPYEVAEQDSLKSLLASEISELPEREKLVLALYYDEELNLREVGEVLGVSESRISQIHTQAMVRLQSRLKRKMSYEEA